MNSDRIYSMVVPVVRRMVKGRGGSGRRHHFEAVPVPPGRVLFLGDTITEGGLWPDPRPPPRRCSWSTACFPGPSSSREVLRPYLAPFERPAG